MTRISRVRCRWSIVGMCLAFLAVAVCCTQTQAAERTLRWKFKKGEALNCVLDQKMTQNLKVLQNDVKVTSAQVIDIRWEINDVDNEGTASMTQTIEKIKMKVETPQGLAIDYDTSTGKDPEGPAAMLSPLFKALVNQPITYKMSSTGKITDMKIPEAMVEGFKKVPGMDRMGGMFSEDGLKQMIGQASFVLPTEAIDVGKTWQNDTTVDQGPIGKMKTTTIYKYAGVETHDGKELDKIETSIKIEYPDADKAETKVELSEQEGKGTMYFDNTLGRPNDSSATSKMKMSVTVQGMKIDTTTDMTMTMKYSAAAKKEAETK